LKPKAGSRSQEKKPAQAIDEKLGFSSLVQKSNFKNVFETLLERGNGRLT
jgi:hypothetical protein